MKKNSLQRKKSSSVDCYETKKIIKLNYSTIFLGVFARLALTILVFFVISKKSVLSNNIIGVKK